LPQHPTKFPKLLLRRNDKKAEAGFDLLSSEMRNKISWLGSQQKYSKRNNAIQEAYGGNLHLRKSRGNLTWWTRNADLVVDAQNK
jgi:hypothetical protein